MLRPARVFNLPGSAILATIASQNGANCKPKSSRVARAFRSGKAQQKWPNECPTRFESRGQVWPREHFCPKILLDVAERFRLSEAMQKSPSSFGAAVLVAMSLFAGCATTGVKPVNPEVAAKLAGIDPRQMATVVIYRESNFYGSALRPTVMLDGQDFVNIGNGRVFVGAIPRGHYVFEMDDRKSGTEVELKPGQAVYMKVELVPGFWKGGGRLLQVAPEQGAFEAKRLELLPAQEIENPAFQ